MTKEQFISKEIATWGEDYIFALIDRGYDAVQLTDQMGKTKWSWQLTQPSPYATLASGSGLTFLPFRQVSRLSDG